MGDFELQIFLENKLHVLIAGLGRRHALEQPPGLRDVAHLHFLIHVEMPQVRSLRIVVQQLLEENPRAVCRTEFELCQRVLGDDIDVFVPRQRLHGTRELLLGTGHIP